MERINVIRNCVVKFQRVCPKTWEHLSPTPAEGVRFCGTCAREVFLCISDAEAVTHARAGHCIAKPAPVRRGLTLTLGEPEVQPTPEELLLQEEASRESAKTDALRTVEYASRMCPVCGYPCADWLKSCRVCGFEIGRHGDGTPAS
jgi:hypothetical protein